MSQGSRALPRLPCLRSNLRHQREGEAAARFRAFVATELRGGECGACSPCTPAAPVQRVLVVQDGALPALPTPPAQRHGYPSAPGCCVQNVCGPLSSFLEGSREMIPRRRETARGNCWEENLF